MDRDKQKTESTPLPYPGASAGGEDRRAAKRRKWTTKNWARGLSLVLAVLVCACPRAADADNKKKPLLQSSWARMELRADLQSLFHFRNDADFDRRERDYDVDGQTVGAFASIFTPALTLHIMDHLRIHYEVELGLNFWSKHNADQQSALASDIFVMKHRQIYGEGEFWDGRLGFKVGYAHFADPTGLFFNHWVGVAAANWTNSSRRWKITFFAGQIPDQTYEGINIGDNNFTHDIWIYGARTRLEISDSIALNTSISRLYDGHVVDRERWVVAPCASLEVDTDRLDLTLDVVVQAGVFEGHAQGSEAQTSLAWAAQGNARLSLGVWDIAFNVMALSPDDAHQGNEFNHAFLYSGKSRSATLMLTEDELRDWYDNLDERMSGHSGGMFLNRAGLLVADIKATWNLHEIYRPSVVVGAATVLKPANALDNTFVGVEADVVLEFHVSDYLVGHLVGGMLIPGDAGGALINRQGGNDATDPIVMTEASLLLRY